MAPANSANTTSVGMTWRASHPIAPATKSAARSRAMLNQSSGLRHQRVFSCPSACPSLAWGFSSRPHRAGVRVSETTAEISTEMAMVSANWL